MTNLAYSFEILDAPPAAVALEFDSEAAAVAEVARRAESEILRLLADDPVINGGIAAEVFDRSQPAKRGYRDARVDGWRTVQITDPDAYGDYEVEFACRLGVRMTDDPKFATRKQIKFRATLRSPDFAANRCVGFRRDTGIVETDGIAKAAASYVRRALPWLRCGAVYAAATPEEKAQLDSQNYGVEWRTGEIVYAPDC